MVVLVVLVAQPAVQNVIRASMVEPAAGVALMKAVTAVSASFRAKVKPIERPGSKKHLRNPLVDSMRFWPMNSVKFLPSDVIPKVSAAATAAARVVVALDLASRALAAVVAAAAVAVRVAAVQRDQLRAHRMPGKHRLAG